jgi:tripartite-type tricarboxylate transporter receptor subunit TctC
MQDLVAGHVDVMFDGLGSSASQINGGSLRALALAAPTRSPAIPNVQTAAEAGLNNYEVSTWYAMWAPKNTPPEIVERMKKEISAALQSSIVKDAWARNGSEVPSLAGAEFGTFVKSEIARWGKVVKDADVKLE